MLIQFTNRKYFRWIYFCFGAGWFNTFCVSTFVCITSEIELKINKNDLHSEDAVAKIGWQNREIVDFWLTLNRITVSNGQHGMRTDLVLNIKLSKWRWWFFFLSIFNSCNTNRVVVISARTLASYFKFASHSQFCAFIFLCCCHFLFSFHAAPIYAIKAKIYVRKVLIGKIN